MADKVVLSADPGGDHSDRDDLVYVANIIKPHGLKGGLKVRILSDNPKRFLPGESLLLAGSHRIQETVIERFVPQNRYGLIKLEGIDSIEQAGEWTGSDLAIPSEKIAPLEAGHYYTFQLLGMSVVSEAGRELGTLSQIEEAPAGDIYQVSGESGQFYIPSQGDIILKIDVERKVMVIRDVEGLR